MNCSLPGASVHGDSPGKNTGVGCHFLLQGIFLTQGSNLNLMSPALAGGFFTNYTQIKIKKNKNKKRLKVLFKKWHYCVSSHL